jgi:peptide deformylase
MAVREILQYPDARLKQVSVPVTGFDAALRLLMRDLEDSMRAGAGSVGVAAPQIGVLQRVVIVDVSAKAGIRQHGCLRLVNPEIVSRTGEAQGREGCMSVPDYTGNVLRAQQLRLRAQDGDGIWREWDFEGYEARTVQHELDHLDGLLFLDRIISPRRDLFRRKVYR